MKHHPPAGYEPKEDAVPPYKYRYCEHHFWIVEYPRLLIAVRCPYCFPEGAANCDPAEYGDHVGFGYMATLLKAAKERGFCKHFGETDPNSFDAQEDAANGRTRIRPDAMYDIVGALRLHLLRKRAIITQRAAILGWNSPAMKAYIRALCLNHLIDLQLRNGEHHVQSGEQGFIAHAADDDGGMGDDFEALPPDTWAQMTGRPLDEAQLAAVERDGAEALTYDTRWLDLEMLLAKIPADLRTAFEARYPCNGEPRRDVSTWREVAARLGIHESAARRRVGAALKQLRAAMEPEKVS